VSFKWLLWVLTGTLYAKVIKIIYKHDTLLRYALVFSKNVALKL